MFILLGKHDLINVWIWFQATECRLLNNHFMATIYSQGKAEVSPPSMNQAMWSSPIMDSELNEHVFKGINSAMVSTHASDGSPLEGGLLRMPQKHVNIDHVPWEERIKHSKPESQCLPLSLVSFPQHWRNPIPDGLPCVLAEVLCSLGHTQKGNTKPSFEIADCTGRLPSSQVWLKHLWERELQRTQCNLSKERNLSSLFNYSETGKGASFSKEQTLHKTCPFSPFEGSVTWDSICSISRRKLFPEQMPMFYVYCIC